MGQYRSSFRGSGLLFSDLRNYEPGDDIKHIHWKATARTGRPYIKTYQEERQLRIILALDISASTNWGAPRSKQKKAREFAALISMLAQKNQDSLGLCLFGGEVTKYLPPSTKRSQFRRVLEELLTEHSLVKSTNIAAALSFMKERLPRSCVIFLVSDFLSTPFETELSILSSRNDVVGVLLSEDQETEIPKAGLIEFEDAESNERIIIDTSSAKVRESLSNKIKDQKNNLQQTFNRSRADFIELRSSTIRPLIDLMNRRARRFSQ